MRATWTGLTEILSTQSWAEDTIRPKEAHLRLPVPPGYRPHPQALRRQEPEILSTHSTQEKGVEVAGSEQLLAGHPLCPHKKGSGDCKLVISLHFGIRQALPCSDLGNSGL
ncbi:hypothetical protein R6Z07F_016653 [Ovis aries]